MDLYSFESRATLQAMKCALFVASGLAFSPVFLAQAVDVAPTDASAPLVEIEPITAEQLESAHEFARQIAWTLGQGDGALIKAAIDYGALISEVTEDLEVTDEFKSELVLELREDDAFANLVIGDRGHSAPYACIAVEPKAAEIIATFRHRPTTGIEYHRYRLQPVAEGVFRVLDIEFVAAGESWGEMVRRRAITRLVAKNRDLVEALTESDALSLEHERELGKVREALARHDGRAALKLLDALPESFKATRRIVALTLDAARLVEGVPFAEVHEAAKKSFPDDAGIDLFAWRHAVSLDTREGLLELHGALESALVPDSYRDALAAEVHVTTGSLRKAIALAEIAVTREPDLEQAWAVLLDVTLARMDFQRVREVLNVLETRFAREMDLEGDLRFAGYLESGEYAADAR